MQSCYKNNSCCKNNDFVDSNYSYIINYVAPL